MDYIVLDMEWNQPWPGSPSSRKVLPVAIRGEIIQIGAVRLTEEQFVADEFQVLVKPKYYTRLNRRVSKLTGIKDSRLKEEGIPFPEAMRRFREWCGEDIVFLTWGFDDIGILRENLRLFGLSEEWTSRWYNAQMFFNAQTDGSTAQKALKTAMEMFEIQPTRPAHDALGDAYHTALICAMLDLKRGIKEYESSLREHENGFHGAELPGCVARKVYYDYSDKTAALKSMSGEENRCPVCNGQMTGTRWFAQPGRRYMDLAECPEHGKFLIRVRMSVQQDGRIRVSRLTYEATSEAAEAYARRAEKAGTGEETNNIAGLEAQERPRTRRRRRHRGERVRE